jgi:hypothetical protein
MTVRDGAAGMRVTKNRATEPRSSLLGVMRALLALVILGSGCGEPVHARVDAGGSDAAAPDAASGFCAGASHDFCADFDESTDATAGWTSSEQQGDCSLDAFAGDYRSAPRALQLHCHATGAGGAAKLVLAVPANGKSRVHLELDYKLTEAVFTDGTQGFSLFTIDDNGVPQVSLVDGANTAWFVNIAHGTNSAPQALPIPHVQEPPLDTWTHASIDVALSTTTGSISWIWNDTTTAAGGAGPNTADVAFTTLGVEIDLVSLGVTSPDATLLVDNIAVDFH